MKYNEEQFKSVFKKDICKYLNSKALLNEQTKSLFYMLRTFDNLCNEMNIKVNILTKDLVLKWLERRPNECKNNQSKRASIIRCFGKYMFKYDNKNFVLPNMLYSVKERYIPHIYSNDEIKKFFIVVDNLNPTSAKDNKPIIMPIIYRLLLLTGMRINEVLSLKIKDVKLDIKTLVIIDAKNHKDRLIPISDEMCERLKKYHNDSNSNLCQDAYFFRNTKGRKIMVDSFYDYFRKYLWDARIPHTGKGPRVHDFRHTFTVNCIHKWLIDNKDVKALLPYLQTYLGHDSVESTYYYFHLTLGLYPYLEEKLTEINNDIIPRLDDKEGILND